MPLLASAALALALPGCSIKKLAVNSLGNALAEGGKSYASDDDPELVREAVPFGLKTVEALLEESPRHKGLLLAAASGFTQYGFAFIQQEADFVEGLDLPRATALRDRARKHYRRGLEYGLRGLEVDFPGFRAALRKDHKSALAPLRRKHVPLLYWTANAWGAAIALSKDDSELSADQNLAEARLVAPTMTFSTAVSPPYRPTPCRVLATPRLASRCGLMSGRRPPNCTSPASGRMKPHKTFSSVVLPAPFGPMTPSTCRGGTASETASSAVSPPKRTVTSCTSSTEPAFMSSLPRHTQQEVPA